MALPSSPFLREDKDGSVWIDIQVTPNAPRTMTDGLHDGALRVRLNAPPVDGKANLALVKWLAAQLKVARAGVSVERGETSRRKQVRIDAAQVGGAQWSALLG
jgi:hypothetical protein